MEHNDDHDIMVETAALVRLIREDLHDIKARFDALSKDAVTKSMLGQVLTVCGVMGAGIAAAYEAMIKH
jgi:hypothetical protein